MGQFLTSMEQFKYSPLLRSGVIVRDRVVNQRDIRWLTDEGEVIVVPKGFVYNLASLPWWIGWALEKLGRHQRAAALHDYLYEKRIGEKSWADKQFLQAMKADKVKGWRRYMAYTGVAVGGWLAWLT